MILNPIVCEKCGESLQPENIGVRLKPAEPVGLIRICLFCGDEVEVTASINKANLEGLNGN